MAISFECPPIMRNVTGTIPKRLKPKTLDKIAGKILFSHIYEDFHLFIIRIQIFVQLQITRVWSNIFGGNGEITN